MPLNTYSYDKPSQVWRKRGGISIPIDSGNAPPSTGPDSTYRPTSYATVMEARTSLNAPSDANYVVWNEAWSDLETAFLALGSNDILVLPERDEPYWIDSSNGFMAAGVESIDGPNGTRTSIVSNSRLWFAMTRTRRGILGMGAGAVIRPTNSGFTAPQQPYPMNRYMENGTTAALSGAQCKLIEAEHANAFFANFTLRSQDFGGVAYSSLSINSTNHAIVKRVHFDGSWRGFAGIPNGETAGLGINNCTYAIENCDFRSENGPSPIMWNFSNGGTVNHVRSTRPNYGMWTFWRSGGVNTFEDVWMDCRQVGMNLEQNDNDFQLNWTTGKMDLLYDGNKFHFGMNPSNGSINIRLYGVTVSPNGYTPNRLCVNVYTTMGVQKRSDVSCDTLPVEYLPGSAWIA